MRLSIAEALRKAIHDEMERDPNVFCIGEDIGIPGGYGGAFTVTLGLEKDFREMGCDDKIGLANNQDCYIMVDKNLTKDKKKSTTLHEIIHLIDYSLDLGLDENTICRLESGLYATLKNNPELIEYFLK